MIGPVRKVERKIFVSVAPVVADPLVTLHDEGADPQGLESSGDVKSTDTKSFSITLFESWKVAMLSPVTAADHNDLRLDPLQVIILDPLGVP